MWWYKCMWLMLFHPVEVGVVVKRRREAIPWAVVGIPLLLTALWRVLGVYLTNYTVAAVSPREAGVLLEVGIGILPVLLWTVASYAFMTIMGGESTFKETLTMSVMSLTPYLVLEPLLILLSRALSYGERGFFTTLQAAVWIWVVLLVFVSFMQSNNLSFRKAVFFSLIVLIVMALLLGVVLLAFALVSQIVLFVQEVASEASFYLS